MFFRPGEPHGLSGNPFNQLVVPRPIGWISSVSADGHANLAPFSFFNAVAYVPPQVMFSTDRPAPHRRPQGLAREHPGDPRVRRESGDLGAPRGGERSSASAPLEVDEFDLAGVTKTPARVVQAPYVAESPVHLECVLTEIVELPTPDPADPNTVVFGEVVGIDIADHVIHDGRVDALALDPIARLGYDQYVRVADLFTMTRPAWPQR